MKTNYDFEKNTFKKRGKNGARNFAFSHTSKSISVILFAGNCEINIRQL